jgi:ABC-type glycerol-3-phosphate transport system substrate-binding protein
MYVQDPVFGLDGPQLEDTPPALLDPVRMSGRWIAMPVLASGAVLFYNQAWGRELGFDEPPQTPAEFRTQACAAAEANRTDDTRDNDGTGGWLVDTSAGTVLSWLHGFGGQELTGSGPLTYRFEQPASLQAFQFLRAMLDENCAWLGRQPAPYEYFAARNALFYSGSVEDILVQERTQSRLSSQDEWMVLPYPRLEGQPAWEVEGLSLALTRGSNAQQLAAWLFVRWLASPAQQARLSRAGGSIPASLAAVDLLADFRQQHPQWDAAVSRPAEQMFSPPPLASWRLARLVVEDAAGQVFQSYVEAKQIPGILAQLDATIQEVGFNLGY